MELILRTEILYRSPEVHNLVRQRLLKCTGNIVANCNEQKLDQCVDQYIEPCRAFKLEYEAKRNFLLEKVKTEMVVSCLDSTDKEICKKDIISQNLQELDKLVINLQNI